MSHLNFILVKKMITFPKYSKGGGGEVAATYGVRASFFESFLFSIFQIKFIKMEYCI